MRLYTHTGNVKHQWWCKPSSCHKPYQSISSYNQNDGFAHLYSLPAFWRSLIQFVTPWLLISKNIREVKTWKPSLNERDPTCIAYVYYVPSILLLYFHAYSLIYFTQKFRVMGVGICIFYTYNIYFSFSCFLT